MKLKIIPTALLALAILPAAAQARPSYGFAKGVATDRAWRDCNNLYPLDPYSQRCATIAIVSGYTHYNASCRYFQFVTLTNRAGRVYRESIKSCDNSHGGFTTTTYKIYGFISGPAGAARKINTSTNPVLDFFRAMGL